jgi:hypothetical protein
LDTWKGKMGREKGVDNKSLWWQDITPSFLSFSLYFFLSFFLKKMGQANRGNARLKVAWQSPHLTSMCSCQYTNCAISQFSFYLNMVMALEE